MTTANKVTIFRILLVPIFIVQILQYVGTGNEWHRLAALLVFAGAAVSDGIDGYLARHYNQQSEVGAWLDPMADKLLLVSGIVLLSLDNEPYLDRIPLWLAGLIIGRDFLLTVGLGILRLKSGRRPPVRPHIAGKLSTAVQMAMILWILLQWSSAVLEWLILGTAGLVVVSAILYAIGGIRQLRP